MDHPANVCADGGRHYACCLRSSMRSIRMPARHEMPRASRPEDDRMRIEGLHNVFYLASVVGAVLASGLWHSGLVLPIGFGIAIPLEDLARDGILLILSYLSWKTTRRPIRIENAFTWTPIQEVAILFAGIFLTMIPALAILRAGREGSFVAAGGFGLHARTAARLRGRTSGWQAACRAFSITLRPTWSFLTWPEGTPMR